MTRETFKTRTGFILAAAGAAVGLGNLISFPSFLHFFGGAFLLWYLIFTLLIGFPVLLCEITVGRAARANSFDAFARLGHPAWRLVGLLGIITGLGILATYNVIAGWSLGYTFAFLGGEGTTVNFEAFKSDVGSNVLFYGLFMAFTVIIIAFGVKRGIERAVKVLMALLVVMLVGLILYSMVRYHIGWQEITAMLHVDSGNLFHGPVITAALAHAFFTLSVGATAMITYGSYLHGDEDLIRLTVSVVTLDVLVGLLAALLLLPLVEVSGKAFEPGPTLLFHLVPQIFGEMGGSGAQVIGALFFVTICAAALTSTISLLELPVAYFADHAPGNRQWLWRFLAATAGGLSVFLVGRLNLLSYRAGSGWDNLSWFYGKKFDDLLFKIFVEIGVLAGGLLLCLFVAYSWGTANLTAAIVPGNEQYRNSKLEAFINFMVRFLAPALVAIALGVAVYNLPR